ncbi:MAG: nucleotide-binding protein [Thermoanaerobaculia bacterium]
MKDLQHELKATLAASVSFLLDRFLQGNWQDVRSTSLGAWALAEVIRGQNVPAESLRDLNTAVSDALEWVSGQAKREQGGVSWDSEAWDTAQAIIALSHSDFHHERIDQAEAWLRKISDPVTGVWYDEVWETTHTTVALLRAEHTRPVHLYDPAKWLVRVLEWLSDLPSKPSGEFLNPHYSGLIVWLLGEINLSRMKMEVEKSTTYGEFVQKALASANWLLSRIAAGSRPPWSAYTFSNSYIALGLATLSRSTAVDSSYIPAAVEWFRERQGERGQFEDVEDTALATLALSAMMDRAELTLPPAARPTRICSQQRCFVGFSSTAESAYVSLRDSLLGVLPTLKFIDWRWDFRAGRFLLSEIENASRGCDAALFLVTKDDAVTQSDGALVESPRDNVVFEIGYFAARLGMERTLLLVEQGTQIPSDWGGIIRVEFKNRSDMSNAVLRSLRELGRIFADQSG